MYNGWKLNSCAGECVQKYTTERTPLNTQAELMNIEPFESILYSQCKGKFVECNKKCLEVYNQDMKLWRPADTPAKEVYTSSDLANCITRADLVAFSDMRNVAHEL
jgi:hypothetical protein